MHKPIYFTLILLFCAFASAQTNSDRITEKDEAVELTEQYFKNILSAKYELAYSSLAPTLKQYFTEAGWFKGKKEFVLLAGKLNTFKASRVTVYNNPPNAKPGLYVAVDYYNNFDNLPVHCGYLVWFKEENSERDPQIIREETGYITKAQMSETSKEQLEDLEQRLRCVRP